MQKTQKEVLGRWHRPGKRWTVHCLWRDSCSVRRGVSRRKVDFLAMWGCERCTTVRKNGVHCRSKWRSCSEHGCRLQERLTTCERIRYVCRSCHRKKKTLCECWSKADKQHKGVSPQRKPRKDIEVKFQALRSMTTEMANARCLWEHAGKGKRFGSSNKGEVLQGDFADGHVKVVTCRGST